MQSQHGYSQSMDEKNLPDMQQSQHHKNQKIHTPEQKVKMESVRLFKSFAKSAQVTSQILPQHFNEKFFMP